MRKWHLVSYDIRDEARLRRVARLIEGYGERIQYSVFRCRLDPVELERLRWELARVTESADDLLIIPLCQHCSSGVRDTAARQHWDQEWPTFQIV